MNQRIPIILCATSTGRAVIFGHVDDKPVPGKPVTLRDARMILCWARECGGLFGLAANGPRSDTRITPTVVETEATEWKEWVAVSDEAAVALREWRSA